MENPVAEIAPIIHLLCQSPPTLQKQTIERYFTRDARFIHPICRTGSFDLRSNVNLGILGNLDDYTCSRFLVLTIFRWYKIMSPKIELNVDSIAFDAENLVLYVTLHQLFKLFFLPRALGARVQLTTKLKLRRAAVDGTNEKYYIVEQNDLYQASEIVKFVDPLGLMWIAFMLWNFAATVGCVLGQWVLAPISWWEDTRVGRNLETGEEIERREKKTEIEKVD